MKSLFLSHSHLDRDMARQIYLGLIEQGIRCWFDSAEIKPGDSIIAKVEQAIDEMDYLGVVLSPASVNSTWVAKELRVALVGEIESRNVRVIGLLIADCTLPAFLRDKKYIDFRPNFQSAMTDIISFLKGENQTVTVPKQAMLATMIEAANEELWDRVGGETFSRRVTANLLRNLTEEELDAAIAIGAQWEGYKQWEADLLEIIQKYADTDRSGANRILRRLVETGLLEEADDLDYARRQQAYTHDNLLFVLKQFAVRSRLFPYLPPPYPETLSEILAYKKPYNIISQDWSAATYGSPITTNLLGGTSAAIIVTRESPPRAWLFSSSEDHSPQTTDEAVNVLYVAPHSMTILKLHMQTQLVDFELSQFDDLHLLI